MADEQRVIENIFDEHADDANVGDDESHHEQEALELADYGLVHANLARLRAIVGTEELDSIDLEGETLASILGAFLKDGLKIHNVHEQDLTIMVPASVIADHPDLFGEHHEFSTRVYCADPLSVGPMSAWISFGNMMFDVIYFFHSPRRNKIVITVLDDTVDEDGNSDPEVVGAMPSEDTELLHMAAMIPMFPLLASPERERLPRSMKRLLWYYLWLMVRGGVQAHVQGTPDQPIPAFMRNSLGMDEPINLVVSRLASFGLTLVNPSWIKWIPIGEAASLIINRLSLGVAGYRMLRPFCVYPLKPRARLTLVERQGMAMRLDPNDPVGALDRVPVHSETLANYNARKRAFKVAKAMGKAPLDWAIHSATRAPWVITQMGGLNKPLSNLMLRCFTAEQLAAMASDRQKLIYRVPVEQPGCDTWMNWDMGLLNNLNDPILPAAIRAMGGVGGPGVPPGGPDDSSDSDDDDEDGDDAAAFQAPPSAPSGAGSAGPPAGPPPNAPPQNPPRPPATVSKRQAGSSSGSSGNKQPQTGKGPVKQGGGPNNKGKAAQKLATLDV